MAAREFVKRGSGVRIPSPAPDFVPAGVPAAAVLEGHWRPDTAERFRSILAANWAAKTETFAALERHNIWEEKGRTPF